MRRPHHYTKAEKKYLGEPFTPEWRRRKAILAGEYEKKDMFQNERFMLDRQQYTHLSWGE